MATKVRKSHNTPKKQGVQEPKRRGEGGADILMFEVHSTLSGTTPRSHWPCTELHLRYRIICPVRRRRLHTGRSLPLFGVLMAVCMEESRI
jgi:hypothetical protein